MTEHFAKIANCYIYIFPIAAFPILYFHEFFNTSQIFTPEVFILGKKSMGAKGEEEGVGG